MICLLNNRTFAMIKPDSYANIGKIMEIIEKNFRISKMKMVKFNREIAEGNKSCFK